MARLVAATIVLIALLSASGAQAQVTTNLLNGYWWMQADTADKVDVVAAMSYAIPDGYMFATTRALPYIDRSKLVKALSDITNHQPQYQKAFNAYIDSIDAVETNPDVRKIIISSIMVCVADGVNTDQCINHDLNLMKQH